jgi:hypothetical protein
VAGEAKPWLSGSRDLAGLDEAKLGLGLLVA